MSVLGGLGDGAAVETPSLFWAIVAVSVAFVILLLIWVGMGKFIEGGKALVQPDPGVSACGINGHVYQSHTAVWLCATCGAMVPTGGDHP
jgi:hypothetical protein